MKMDKALKPSPALLAKIGSIVVHVQEGLSPTGHHFDLQGMKPLLADPEVVEWIEAMGVLLPKKR